MSSIPVIDLQELTNSNLRLDEDSNILASKSEGIAKQVRNALHSVGFMYLINHRISPETINSAFKESALFFDLNEQTKEKYRKIPVETNHGWIQAGQELLHPNSVFELREGFDFVSGDRCPIPESPGFCPTMDKFKAECASFMEKTLLPLLSLSLDLDPSFFNSRCKHLTSPEVPNECDLRVIYYPPIPPTTEIPKGTIRCAEHTDYELCTLLFQDDVGGLEVKTSEGNWIPATPIPGSILVNTGDLLEHWTSGFFPATFHRVIIPDQEIDKRIPRYSFAYFFAPDNETKVSSLKSQSPIIKAHSSSSNEKEAPDGVITAYEHIMKRVKEAYKY